METLEPIETIDYQGYTIEIHIDDNPQNPRDDDNLGTMVCFHNKYNLGDKNDYRSQDYRSYDAIEKAIQKDTRGALILPLYMMDHSGLSISTSDTWFRAMDAQAWDWGQIGFIYIAKSKVRQEYGVKAISQKLKGSVLDILKSEVETYNNYVNGDVHGYVVRDGNGREVGSCWGFTGNDDLVRRAAMDVVDHENCKIRVHTFINRFLSPKRAENSE